MDLLLIYKFIKLFHNQTDYFKIKCYANAIRTVMKQDVSLVKAILT